MEGSDKRELIKVHRMSLTKEDLEKEAILLCGGHNSEQSKSPFTKDLRPQQPGALSAPAPAVSSCRVYLGFGELPPEGGLYPITNQSRIQRTGHLATTQEKPEGSF